MDELHQRLNQIICHLMDTDPDGQPAFYDRGELVDDLSALELDIFGSNLDCRP